MKRFLATLLAVALLTASTAAVGNPKHTPTPSETQVIKTALKSIGHVTGVMRDEDDDPHTYGCTAFSIEPCKYLTAAHCVGEDMKVDGVGAVAVKVSVEKDLAVLLVDAVKPALTLRQRALQFLETAIGLGYGYSWRFPTVTWHKALMFKYSPFEDVYPGTWFQGGFIGGMSGGPIIDVHGQVVGVVQRGNGASGYGVGVDVVEGFLKGE